MRRAGALLLVGVLLAGGCGAGHRTSWREVALAPGAMVRDAVPCGSRTFVVGGVRDASGGTRPAVWSSTDALSWASAATAPVTFYGEQNVLSAVACRADGRLVAVGAKSGGVHGNPRTSSWVSPDGRVFGEVAAEFELFGGNDAVNVGRVAAGPAGFLIAGNRVPGAAVWFSPDGAGFSLRAGVPGLTSDAAGATWADDAVWAGRAGADGGGWLVVGGVRPPGRSDRDGLGWRSADGAAWSRVPVGGATDGVQELQRVAVLGGVPLAVGVSGSAFGSWRLVDGQWRPAGDFGTVRVAGAGSVRSLAVVGPRVYAVTSDGAGWSLWVSADGVRWDPMALPVEVPGSADAAVVVTGVSGRVVVLADGGAGARSFVVE